MDESKLLDAIGEIDDEIIAEADKIRNTPHTIKPPKTHSLAIAACLIATVSLTLVTARFISQQHNIAVENADGDAMLVSPDGVKPGIGESEVTQQANITIPEAETKGTTDETDDGSTHGSINDGAEETVPETVPETGIPETAPVVDTEADGNSDEVANPIILYRDTPLPDDPKPITQISLQYENGDYTGENLDYTDNAMLRQTGDGVVLALCFYQDSLDYTADITNTLRRCVTLDYDGIRYDNLDYANSCITVTVNGSHAILTEVSLGMGNGHVDYYFTVVYTDGSKPNTLDSFTFEVKADEHRDNSADDTVMPSENPPSEAAEPMILPKFVPDGTDYFNYGHRTYTLWQKVTDVNDGIALFEVTDTIKSDPDEPYTEYGGTVTSGVYPIAGFNTDFALAATVDGEYYAFIYLNDINLTAPEKLLFTLFKIDEKFLLTGIRTPSSPEPEPVADGMRASREYGDFLDALHNSRFAEPTKLLKTLIAELYFTSDDGITLTLNIYELFGEHFVSVSNINGLEDIPMKVDSSVIETFVKYSIII